MPTVTVKFDADISDAKKQLADLKATGVAAQKALAEGTPGDRRAGLEALRQAKEQLAAAEKEKLEIEGKIKAQAASVREARAAVNAAKEGTKEHSAAARELEKQERIFARMRDLGNLKGQVADQARINMGAARNLLRLPGAQVQTAPAISGFARIREAGIAAARHVGAGFSAMNARISRAFSGLRGMAAGAFAALGINAGVQGLRNLVNELDDLAKSARNLGMDAASFQKLEYAAKSLNVPFEGVKNAVAIMQRTIGEAAGGSVEAERKFQRLGITLTELDGKSSAEQFDIIARAINAIPDQAQKAAAAADIFGKSGVKMLSFLREYKGIGDDLAARGGIINDAQLRAAEEFNQAITDISRTLKTMTINSGLLKQLAELLKVIEFFSSGRDKAMEARAASMGVYNRKTGTALAVRELLGTGRFSPAEATRLQTAGNLYALGKSSPGGELEKEYGIIDAELRRRGLGALARREKKHWFGGTTLEFGEDTTASARQTSEERAAEAARRAAERQKSQAEAAKRAAVKAKAEAEAAADLQKKLDVFNAGTPETREAFVEQRLRQAEQMAKSMRQVLSAEQREQVIRAAGAKFDEAEAKKVSALDDYLANLERQYKVQQMIAAGKGREAAIEERLAEARKRAAEAGKELTQDQEAAIAAAAGGMYDLAHPEKKATGPGRIGADVYATYGLRSVGGLMEGATRVGTMAADYPRQTAEAVRNLEQKVDDIYEKLPERTEAGTMRLTF